MASATQEPTKRARTGLPCWLSIWPPQRTASAVIVSKPNQHCLVLHNVALFINCCVEMKCDHGLPFITADIMGDMTSFFHEEVCKKHVDV
jgi:hypothetical protein